MEDMKKKLLLVFILYFVIQIFLTQNHTLTADEGTHALIGLFYKDIFKNIQNFHSIERVMNFATDYIVKYPKISPYYPPLYDFLIATVFLFTYSLTIIRILNIGLTLLTAFIIYEISKKILKEKNSAFICQLFFLLFTIIFYNASKIMADILQILMFSIVILYYLKLRDKKTISKTEILKLSILLALAFLTKYFSIFLPLIILLDSYFTNRKFFKYFLLSIILSLIIISPYVFFYIKFKFYKLLLGVATAPYWNQLVYFNIFSNFGLFLGPIVAISVIWFIWKNLKNPLILTWFFAPLCLFLLMKDCDPRFAFILMPIYAISCGFLFEKIQKINLKQKKNLFIGIFIILLLIQLLNDIIINYQNFNYPVNYLMKSISTNGSVLIMTEEPVYSSVYIFYGYINNVKGNIFRPCIIEKYKISKEFFDEWGIRYLIDQNNTITEKIEKSLDLKVIEDLESKNFSMRLFETNVKNLVDCNFVCTLQGKVCKGQGFSKILSLINNSTSTLFE